MWLTKAIMMRLTKAIVMRIVLDVLLTVLSVLMVTGALLLFSVWVEPLQAFSVWLPCTLVLMVGPAVIFPVFGVYTHGRAYRVRYKLRNILFATSLTHLVAWFVGLSTPLPSGELLVFLGLSWMGSNVLIGGLRVMPLLWSSGKISRSPSVAYKVKDCGLEIQKVLIIGGAGYIGSALVKRLLELGYSVRVLDLLVYGDESISDFYAHPDFELIKGDFRNIHTVVSATKGMDAIVHLGAIVGDSACGIDEDVTIEINLRATRTIAEVGKGFGVNRFVFASTCSVYGASPEILDERSALKPISLYARTKMESERVLLGLAGEGFVPTILRFGTIYGLSGRPRFDLVVNLLTAKAVREGQAGIFGGQQWRPLVHVRDVAEAITLTLRAPLHAVRGQIFNVGSNEQNYQVADLGVMIQEMVPAARVVTQPKEDDRNYRVRFDKIRDVLRFEPHYTVRDGICEIIEAFETGRIQDYRDPRYNNYCFLKQNGELRTMFMAEAGSWEWLKLSAIDAMMLTEVVLAVTESRSPLLKSRLRKSLVQAILGDVDGFLDTLTDARSSSPQRVLEYAPQFRESLAA
jgi:nucleoside-diphosphate-sugar epimerase